MHLNFTGEVHGFILLPATPWDQYNPFDMSRSSSVAVGRSYLPSLRYFLIWRIIKWRRIQAEVAQDQVLLP